MVRVLREACSGQKHCGATPQVVWQLWCYLAEIFGTTISFWMWHRLGVLKLAIYFSLCLGGFCADLDLEIGIFVRSMD